MPEADNLRRGDDTRRDLYEVWYLTWNDPRTGQGFWLRYITEPGRGELWFARFDLARPDKTFGIHKAFATVETEREPFRISIGGAMLGHDRARGEVSGAGHTARWDLRWDPASHALRHLPNAMYTGGGRGDTTVLSPNPRVPLYGSLEVDGEGFVLDGAVVGQTHLWGRKHAFSWTWGRCAEFSTGDQALLELLGVRLQRGGVTLPPLVLVSLELDGELHRFNQFRHVVRNRGTWRTGHVDFTAWSPKMRLEGQLSCDPDDLVLAPYEDPDGTHVFCANTEIGDARIRVFERHGIAWRERRFLESLGRAHFETGGRERDPSVKREHVLV